jgi:3-oxoadipate enol-lactonase
LVSCVAAFFCGISLGGMTGLWLNRHAPQRFHRIVVANTAARIGQREGWLQRAETVRQQGMATIARSAHIDKRGDLIQHKGF